MENQLPDLSRRSFIAAAAGTAITASALAAPAPARAIGAGDRIRIGFIGPGGRGFGAHVHTLANLRKAGANIDLVAVSEVYKDQENKVCDYIKRETGTDPKRYVDYRDMLADDKIDAVCIGTPDHWHATQTIDAMKAGKHVYCEKPMTHTVEEALNVVDVWRSSGKVMQVGVQSTSLPIWDHARQLIDEGKLGKVLQFQTEYYRNSKVGQWRYYQLTPDMTPKTIDWQRWLGVKEGLAPDMPFDRAVYKQWRCYWPFGSGMYTDLFVHRTTSMLKATGLRYPARVVGAGGIYLEYDKREVPDVATVVADYNEGVQALITATMCCQETPIRQLIRGHNGSFVFASVGKDKKGQEKTDYNGERFNQIEFVAERPQVTMDSTIKSENIRVGDVINDSTQLHFQNWLDAMRDGNQAACHNPPDLGAAAIVTVTLGSRSYREGKVFHFDTDSHKVREGDASWAQGWEKMSKAGAKPHHVPGWKAGETGSLLESPPWMKLAGPWKNGNPPQNQG
ncbi:MAG TPA: Gfo/Idh/MocA family oxidoreductase [Pirellulales bacterium]|jgi:predicted dehydrogenase|nr:Gfo/Idh/MocA family oxidoreductase [Pirellulales bacterium]